MPQWQKKSRASHLVRVKAVRGAKRPSNRAACCWNKPVWHGSCLSQCRQRCSKLARPLEQVFINFAEITAESQATLRRLGGISEFPGVYFDTREGRYVIILLGPAETVEHYRDTF